MVSTRRTLVVDTWAVVRWASAGHPVVALVCVLRMIPQSGVEFMSLGKVVVSPAPPPPPFPRRIVVLPLQLYLISMVHHFCFIFKTVLWVPAHCPPRPLVGAGRVGQPRRCFLNPCGAGSPQSPSLPRAWMLQSHPRSLHSAPCHVQGPGELRRVRRWPGAGLGTADGGPSPSSASASSQPRLSMKKYSSRIFTMCVIFLFYIGKENFFDTHKTIQGNL